MFFVFAEITFYAVAMWLVTGEGFQNTKWPAVLNFAVHSMAKNE